MANEEFYFYDAYGLEAKFDGTNWVNITADVVGKITGGYGIFANGPLDRIGDVGELNFTLLSSKANSSGILGYYTPGHPQCRAGFEVGLEVRLFLTIDGTKIIKWSGRVPQGGLKVDTETNNELTEVTCEDYMGILYNHYLKSPTFTTNKRSDEVLNLILADVPIQPATTDFATGVDTFPCVFDTAQDSTTAISEAAKVIFSEWSYLYMTRLGLKAENRYTREYIRELTPITGLAGYLLDSAGNHLTTSAGDRILVDFSDTETINWTDHHFNLSNTYAKNLFNEVAIAYYPRIFDTEDKVFFNLDTSTKLIVPVGQSTVIYGYYASQDNENDLVACFDMIQPIPGSDFIALRPDGGNISLNVDVTVVYYSNSFQATITNNHPLYTATISLLQLRGYGIYITNPIKRYYSDATSIAKNGTLQLLIEAKYQDDPTISDFYSPILLEQYKTASLESDHFDFYIGRKKTMANAFVYAEPGNRVRLKDSSNGVDSDFFINGVKFEIEIGGIVTARWYVREARLDSYDFAVWDYNEWNDHSKWGF